MKEALNTQNTKTLREWHLIYEISNPMDTIRDEVNIGHSLKHNVRSRKMHNVMNKYLTGKHDIKLTRFKE